MGLLQRLLMVSLLGLLSGCIDRPDDDFFVQPEWESYLERVPADMGFQPVVTSWERTRSLEANLDSCTSPQQATETWAAFHELIDPVEPDDLSITIRTRHNPDSTATGLVQRWGFQDDALAGTDYQITMQDINGCWQPTRVETRHYCRRGKSQENLCL